MSDKGNEINIGGTSYGAIANGAKARATQRDVTIDSSYIDEGQPYLSAALVALRESVERNQAQIPDVARVRRDMDLLEFEVVSVDIDHSTIRDAIRRIIKRVKMVNPAFVAAVNLLEIIEGSYEATRLRDSQTTGDERAEEAIAVEIYLDTEDAEQARRVFSAFDNLSRLLGYTNPVDESIERGSFIRRARVFLRQGLSSSEVQNRLVKLERTFELKHLDSQQADVDAKSAESVAQLIASLEQIPQAAMRVGSLFIVKYQDAGNPVLLVRTLSQIEIRALERYPEIQTVPRHALQSLATAIASQEETPSAYKA